MRIVQVKDFIGWNVNFIVLVRYICDIEKFAKRGGMQMDSVARTFLQSVLIYKGFLFESLYNLLEDLIEVLHLQIFTFFISEGQGKVEVRLIFTQG